MKIKFNLLKNMMLIGLTSLPIYTFAVEADTNISTNKEISTKPIIEHTTISPDKQVLMTKLAKIDFFSANFIQKIFSESGELLQQGAGTLAISKPNLVNWQTTQPDETFIISDGKTLWFYDPFIEQATAYDLSKSIHNTPILLLTSNDEMLWQQYTVQKNDSDFVITPLSQNSQIKQLTIIFSEKDKKEHLKEFSFVDATGQISTIILADFDALTKPNASLFDFSLPQGVRLEDKR